MSRDLFDSYTKAFESRRETVMTIQEYLEDPMGRVLALLGSLQSAALTHSTLWR